MIEYAGHAVPDDCTYLCADEATIVFPYLHTTAVHFGIYIWFDHVYIVVFSTYIVFAAKFQFEGSVVTMLTVRLLTLHPLVALHHVHQLQYLVYAVLSFGHVPYKAHLI